MMRRIAAVGLLGLALLAGTSLAADSPGLMTPEQFLGFRVGTDRKLARWDQVLTYLRRAAQASPRIRYEELGKSTLGNSFPMLAISSPQNLSRLKEIQAAQRKLAYPYALEDREADALIRRNPLVVLITCTIHSSEIASTQMCLELVHELATDTSPRIREMLDRIVFLLVPSLNPDGQVLVVDWYQKNVGTPYEYASIPFLYHPYTGHDDNRDAYMLTQIESRLITRVLYKDWFPIVYLDEHQMGSSGPRIFVPPFEDPINPNQDPLVIATSSQIGMHLFTALNEAGLPGAVYGERFTWWWQGSFKNGGWYHNMFGLLSEVASARIASPYVQRRAPEGENPAAEPAGDGEEGGADPRRPAPPPRDTWARTNYPRPWRGGTWTLRDIVDYELVITRALLQHCAAQQETYQRYFHRLNRKAIDRGRRGNPFAYVLPPDQRDPGAAVRLLDVLDQAGIEIYRARAGFQADGAAYPAGSWIIPMAQPFRNYAKDLLEPQRYPMRPSRPGQAPERPYDVTGWTLPLQMGVRAVEVKAPFAAGGERVSPIPPFAGRIRAAEGGTPAGYLAPRAWNSAARLINGILNSPEESRNWEVAALSEPWSGAGARWPAGTWWIAPAAGGRGNREGLERLAREHSVEFTASLTTPATRRRLRPLRIALYQPWTANMDEGWTRWVLEQYGFPYTTVRNSDLRAGGLRERFDAVLFASQSRTSILNGNRGEWNRPEHRGGVGAEGVRALEEFVRQGGTLIALDAAGEFAIREFQLPIRNVLASVPPARFFCPGAILQTQVDPEHPIAYGMPESGSAYFLNSPAYEVEAREGEPPPRVVVRYPLENPLQSGWIGGPEHLRGRAAVVEAPLGRGKVVLLGFRVQFRGQSHGTFPLLFNSLFETGTSAAVGNAPAAIRRGSGRGPGARFPVSARARD